MDHAIPGNTPVKTFACLLVSALLLLNVGCASSGSPERESALQTIEGVQAYRTSAQDAKQQVGETLSAMEALPSAGSNLASVYKRYVDQVKDMDDALEELREQRGQMRSQFASYQEQWFSSTVELENDTLRQAAQRRIEEVRTDFNAVTPMYNQVTESGQPFLNKLHEVRRYLANDLTVPALKAVAPALEEARQDASSFRTALDRLIVQLTTLQESLQPETSGQ